MRRLALVLALALALGGGCAHRQATNKQIAGVAVIAAFYAAAFVALVAWCHQGCDTQ